MARAPVLAALGLTAVAGAIVWTAAFGWSPAIRAARMRQILGPPLHDAATPLITCDDPVIDVGTFWAGPRLHGTFYLHNHGDVPIWVELIACCWQPRPVYELPPHRTTPVRTAGMDSRRLHGSFAKHINVQTVDDPLTPMCRTCGYAASAHVHSSWVNTLPCERAPVGRMLAYMFSWRGFPLTVRAWLQPTTVLAAMTIAVPMALRQQRTRGRRCETTCRACDYDLRGHSPELAFDAAKSGPWAPRRCPECANFF